MMNKLTPAQRKALQWMVDYGPTGLFPAPAPHLSMVKNLTRMGMLEELPRPRGGWLMFIQYQITDLGRAALAKETP